VGVHAELGADDGLEVGGPAGIPASR
jgi:hypothetical protein